MNRNYEKELGITQQKLQEAIAKEIMFMAMIDDVHNENDELKKELAKLKNNNQEVAEK